MRRREFCICGGAGVVGGSVSWVADFSETVGRWEAFIAFVSSHEVRTLGRARFKSKAALRSAMALVVAACREVRS